MTPVIEQLENLYAQLPALPCLGLCEASCGEHIDASITERRRLLKAGVDLDASTQRARHPSHHLPAVGCDGLDAVPAWLPT